VDECKPLPPTLCSRWSSPRNRLNHPSLRNAEGSRANVTFPPRQGLADIARRVIGCHITVDMRVGPPPVTPPQAATCHAPTGHAPTCHAPTCYASTGRHLSRHHPVQPARHCSPHHPTPFEHGAMAKSPVPLHPRGRVSLSVSREPGRKPGASSHTRKRLSLTRPGRKPGASLQAEASLSRGPGESMPWCLLYIHAEASISLSLDMR
jgi:hypothetical protein